MPQQASELEVVEAAAEGVERRVTTRRHPTPAGHARAERERGAQALDGIAHQHEQACVWRGRGEQGRYPGRAHIQRRPLARLASLGAGEVLAIAVQLAGRGATGVEAVEVVKLLRRRRPIARPPASRELDLGVGGDEVKPSRSAASLDPDADEVGRTDVLAGWTGKGLGRHVDAAIAARRREPVRRAALGFRAASSGER